MNETVVRDLLDKSIREINKVFAIWELMPPVNAKSTDVINYGDVMDVIFDELSMLHGTLTEATNAAYAHIGKEGDEQ